MTTDAIILAGGNGSRLEGVAATGMKPFLVINGEALISRLVRQVRLEVSRVIVVTSPVNTQAMCSLLGTGVEYVVQPEQKGPGDALLRGMAASSAKQVAVLMGDNHMDDLDISTCLQRDMAPMVIGVRRETNQHVAARFTRVCKRGHNAVLCSEEGPEFADPNDPSWVVWCGPLVLPRQAATHVLQRYGGEHPKRELKIGPYLNQIAEGLAVDLVPVNGRDIGVVEELQ